MSTRGMENFTNYGIISCLPLDWLPWGSIIVAFLWGKKISAPIPYYRDSQENCRGSYHVRAQYRAGDEIGELAQAQLTRWQRPWNRGLKMFESAKTRQITRGNLVDDQKTRKRLV